MAHLDRTKHDFDLLEHVLGGIHAMAEDEVGGLVTSEVHKPNAMVDADYEVAVEVRPERHELG